MVGQRVMARRTTRVGATKSSTQLHPSKGGPQDESKNGTKDEMDVMALPLSSDEEQEKPDTTASKSPPTRKMTARRKILPSKTRATPPMKASQQGVFSTTPDIDDLFESSQPKKKRKFNYSARTIHIDEAKEEQELETGFTMPAALPSMDEPVPETKFKVPQSVGPSGRGSSRNAEKEKPFRAPPRSPLKQPANTGPKFSMPTMLAGPDSSAPSQADSVFDIPEPSQREARQRRSGSSSSLSSHSSIELLLSLEEQRALLQDDTHENLDETTWDICDICDCRVERALFRELDAKFKGSGIRRRQRICEAHRRREADQGWNGKGYPTIDWELLEAERIPKHINHLIEILCRNGPSFYRSKLDNVARDPQTSRKAVNNYLKDGILSVAKQGYYGPRGARIMGHVITTTMEGNLEAALEVDKVVRAAGVGGYITAVLVPELMVELVKEDMRVDTDDEARQILEKSTEDGAVLNGDDDEVVLRTGRDNF